MSDHPFDRVVCWFSCGAASAAATRLALDRHPEAVIAYCASTLTSEHPDNERFIEDCERWYGRPILRLHAEEYTDVWDVWKRTRWLVGPAGARCTVELKKRVRRRFQRLGDLQVFGFDVSERARAQRFAENNLDVDLWSPLIDANMTKAECLIMLHDAGIELPAMYRLGYRNNNCIGCVKGGVGYWNKIRRDFPETFARMAALEREIGAAVCKATTGDRAPVYLDKLDPYAGRYEQEPEVQCGVLCEIQIPLFGGGE